MPVMRSSQGITIAHRFRGLSSRGMRAAWTARGVTSEKTDGVPALVHDLGCRGETAAPEGERDLHGMDRVDPDAVERSDDARFGHRVPGAGLGIVQVDGS